MAEKPETKDLPAEAEQAAATAEGGEPKLSKSQQKKLEK
jgi:hypothetical protein